jgi:hypothetical protein
MKSVASRLLAMSGLVLGLGVGAAQANIVVGTPTVAVAAGGSNWTYSVSIDSIQTSSAGSFFTLYDFMLGPAVFVSDTGALASSFTFSTSLTNTPAPGTTPTDSAALGNARFTETSGSFTNTSLGTFTLFAAGVPVPDSGSCSIAICRTVSFDGSATKTDTGLQQSNLGSTFAPVPAPILGAGLPGLLAACGGLLALARRRRQKLA